MLTIKSDNPNYLAKVILLPELRPHPNADRLSLVTTQGQNIITSNTSTPGELYVLFQLESRINREFLSFINGFSDPEQNKDKTKKGFFAAKNCRVKATKLRGIMSEGYLHPAKEVNEWLKSIGIKYQITEKDVNVEFDTIGEVLFVEKYVNLEALRKLNNIQKNKGGKVKRESRIIENQFRLSPDYKHLKREISSINPQDWIEITSKWHGANCVSSRLLTKRKLSFVERILKKLGVKINDTEYNLLFSSRKVIKSEEFRDNPASSFYTENVWEIVAKKYQESLKDGISLYGELVGYTPSGGGIQSMNGKVYDYGCEVGKCDFFVFRVTYTSVTGDVYEFSLPQVIDYCQKYGLKHVPVYYIGQAKDKYPGIWAQEHWHENFLNNLIGEYLEKDDIYCKNKGLADEGIVLSKRVGGFEGLKLKSTRFVLGESEQLDTGEIDLEEVC